MKNVNIQTDPSDNQNTGYRCAIILDVTGEIAEVIHNVPDMSVEIYHHEGGKVVHPGRPVFDFAVKAARKLKGMS